MEHSSAVIILAAGASSRLGIPKQTLPFKQTTLLEHSITEALHSIADLVIVVLGAGAAGIQPAVQHKKLSFVINEHWQEGMASSIRCGLQYLLAKQPSVQAALLMVCDQPYISTALLDKLVTLRAATGSGIAASSYGGTKGIPAIFEKILFPALLQLNGDTGAKKIIMDNVGSVPVVVFPLGTVDIDTQDEYKMIQKKEKD
jgi:molybdenum cofactor cytidylyltransferase